MSRLERFLSHCNRSAAAKAARFGYLYDSLDSHTRFAARPNLYEEHDIGTKNVRYPDGRFRSVRVRKVKDTAGRTFLYLPDAPLS